jgi:nucleotide-binding universal stress UspA family protein
VREDALFNDILVSLQGTEADWRLLDSTLLVAQREEGQVMAIHAVDHEAELDNEETAAIEQEFYRRCAEAGVEGQFAAEVGNEGKLMIKRAPWTDLLTTNLTFATDQRPSGRLSAGVKMLIQRCPRPILVVASDTESPLGRALLAYDGSPKADEALFVATYLALRWQIELAVVTVPTNYTEPQALDRARGYLISNHLVNVTYILGERPITEALLRAAADQQSNLLIVGGFGYRPWQHLVLGSTVDELLLRCKLPILVCR